MTADGQHILGPVPAADGFFVAGRPSLDLEPLSITRFGAGEPPEERLEQEAAWQYRHFYGAV